MSSLPPERRIRGHLESPRSAVSGNFLAADSQGDWGSAMWSNSAGLQTIGVSTFAGRLRMARQSYLSRFAAFWKHMRDFPRGL